MSLGLYELLDKIERHLARQSVIAPPSIVGIPSEFTIATGAITLTGYDKIRVVTIDTEADAASDDLDTISGGVNGDVIICHPASSARTVVFKDATGNLQLAGDFTADNVGDMIMLVQVGVSTFWEVSRSDNGA